MKKTLFITMLAAALMGGQVLAEEFIPTTVTGATKVDNWSYAGAYSTTADVSGASVTIQKDLDHGDDHSSDQIYGGFTDGEQASATYNSVTMSSGQVDSVRGGSSGQGDASNNTVTISGGQVDNFVYGGYSPSGNAENNTVVLSGGRVKGAVSAAYGRTAASKNHVYLLGKGANAEIGGKAYTGSDQGVTVDGDVYAIMVGSGAGSDNTIEIYGTGISVRSFVNANAINFHITESLLSAEGPMLTCTAGNAVYASKFDFLVDDATTDWTAFAGRSITLIQSKSSIVVPEEPEVDITDAEGNVLATATLTLGGEDGKILYLSFGGGSEGPDALDVALVNSLWASSAYVGEFVRLSEAQGYALKAGDTAMWGGGFGTFMHVTGDKGFKSNGGGYGIGVNHAFSDNTQGGLSFGQGFGSYHNSGADGATVHQRAILAAATASTRIAKDFSLNGHLAYGSVRNRADCRLEGGSERARWNDNVFNLGARAAYDFHASDATAITPFLGLDWMYGAQESINGAYARHYSHGRLNELRLPVGVTVSTSAEVGSTKLLPQLSVAYVPAIAQQNPHANVSTDGADYRVKGYAPGRNAFMLNVGMNAVFSENWSAGASYTLETRRHAVDQSVNASVRYTF